MKSSRPCRPWIPERPSGLPAASRRGSNRFRAWVWQRRPRNTPIWKLEAALKCRSCKKGRYAPPVHIIKLTATQEITPYVWVHADEERRACSVSLLAPGLNFEGGKRQGGADSGSSRRTKR